MREEFKPPQKEYFTVKVETLVPTTVTYRVYAESPDVAIDMVKRGSVQFSQPPQFMWGQMKRLKATVYNAGTVLIRLARRLT
jgi:hypothetical protein